MSLTSASLDAVPGILHGFGDKHALMPPILAPWQASLALKKQVHGTHIVRVTEPAQQCGEADGLWTSQPGLLLTVLTADCLPLLFCRRDGRAIGVVHAGWRGLLAGIIEQFAASLPPQDSPANWLAVIGPAAGACCYEVSPELMSQFLDNLPMPASMVQPRPRHLDLSAIALYKLRALGFCAPLAVNQCTICLSCSDAQSDFRYTSFRRNSQQREKDPGRPTISGRNQHSGLIMVP